MDGKDGGWLHIPNPCCAQVLFALTVPESEGLRIEYFGHLFDNTSECYKMFWFQVIVEKILAGKSSASYEEITDEMVTDAWYMVAEYHLNLGPRDNLEFAVNRLVEISVIRGLRSTTTRSGRISQMYSL